MDNVSFAFHLYMTFCSTIFYNPINKRILPYITISATLTSTFPYFSACMVFPAPFCGQTSKTHFWYYLHMYQLLPTYVSVPSNLLYHCFYFPQLVYITSFLTYKKWYIHNYEDTAWRTHAKEKIDRASGQHHDRVVPVYGAWNKERGHATGGHSGTAGKRLEGEILRPSWDWLPIKFNKCSEFRARRRKN